MTPAHDGAGLTEAEAARRLQAVGPNALPSRERRGLFRIIAETLREPMFFLLLAAAFLYLVLGDLLEGLFLVGGAVVTVGLVILQENRSERTLAALNRLAQPKARAIRDGTERLIPARDLVPGDVILVGEGERAPADALLIGGDVLRVDESAMTGESSPVAKRPATPGEAFGEDTAAGEEVSPFVFSGSMVVRGQGVAEVARTGASSALGRIGGSLRAITQEQTPLQKTAGRLAAIAGVFAIGFCIAVAVAYGLLRSDWVGGGLFGLTLAIGLIPEEFPMTLAVFLALGAWRMAKQHVLVRRSAAIEALGGATVLCVDKTGTLTENRMQVACLWTPEAVVEVAPDRPVADGPALELLRCGVLASAVRPVDPMDRAVHRLMARSQPDWSPARAGEPDRIWPLRPQMMAVVQLWGAGGEGQVAVAKGAPEAVWRLCRLGEAAVAALQATVEQLAERGLRLLAVAEARPPGAFPDEPQDVAFQFRGLIGFLDPVRPEVPAAVREAHAAGIRVIMITGDHPTTALAIARAAGLDGSDGALTGPELSVLTRSELAERLLRVRVCARITPEQKLLIVETLKAEGEIVAMTGDGVNDAPALKAAHIGVAMGRRGTDVAREASDMVLLDDSFASIVAGVRLGRRTFANLRSALIYITAVHVPIAGLALAPIAFGLPPLLYPMHVMLLELATDPICALVFEGEPSDAQAMARPPRPPSDAIFAGPQLRLALLQGVVVLAGVLGLYVWALQHYPEAQARGAGLIALVLSNVSLALSEVVSGRRALFAVRRTAFWLVALTVGAILVLVFVVPVLTAIFRVQTPAPGLLAIALATTAVAVGLASALRARMGLVAARRAL